MKRYWHKMHMIKGIVLLLSLINSHGLAQSITSTSINQAPIDEITTNDHVQYPHQSTTMSLGQFESYTLQNDNASITIEQPICVIGNDNHSLNWLNNYADYLKSIGAICLIAEISSLQQVEALQKQYSDIKMAVANVDWIAKLLGVIHYPVLITEDQVLQ